MVDTPGRFPCTVMHPGLFPAILTDPFNPPKIVVRFHFTPLKHGKAFYLEIAPEHKVPVRQVLLSARIALEDDRGCPVV